MEMGGEAAYRANQILFTPPGRTLQKVFIDFWLRYSLGTPVTRTVLD